MARLRLRSSNQARSRSLWLLCTSLLLAVGCLRGVHSTARGKFEDRLLHRISLRESMVRALNAPFVGCKPDAFPALQVQGFCSDVQNLDLLCTDLEVSVSSACAFLDGSYCCYISLAQGNTLSTPLPSTGTSPTTPSQTSTSTSTGTPTASTQPNTPTMSTSTAPSTPVSSTTPSSTSTSAVTSASTTQPTAQPTGLPLSTSTTTTTQRTIPSSATTSVPTAAPATTPQRTTSPASTASPSTAAPTTTTSTTRPTTVPSTLPPTPSTVTTTSSTTTRPTSTTTVTAAPTTQTTTVRTNPPTVPPTAAPTTQTTTTTTTTVRTNPPTAAPTTQTTTTATTTVRNNPPTAAPTAPPTAAPITTPPVGGGGGSPDCAGSRDPIACPNVRSFIVDTLNNFRRSRNAANMLRLEWDDVTARAAQVWANKCRGANHDFLFSTSAFKVPGDVGQNGQNTAAGQGDWKSVLDDWNAEGDTVTVGERCPAVLDPLRAFGHFLQDVWATTFQIGCAFSPCPDSGPQYVCNFGPGGNNSPGNNRAQLCVNAYLPGTAVNGGVCGKCLGSCDNGLCTNPCRFANIINNNDLCDRFVRARGGRCGQDVSSQSCRASCNCLDNLIY